MNSDLKKRLHGAKVYLDAGKFPLARAAATLIITDQWDDPSPEAQSARCRANVILAQCAFEEAARLLVQALAFAEEAIEKSNGSNDPLDNLSAELFKAAYILPALHEDSEALRLLRYLHGVASQCATNQQNENQKRRWQHFQMGCAIALIESAIANNNRRCIVQGVDELVIELEATAFLKLRKADRDRVEEILSEARRFTKHLALKDA